jgi:type IV pilus assembly protein PilY1
MLVDAFGNVREDTNGNAQLDLVDDYIITFEGETVVKYKDINGDGQLTDFDLNHADQINVTGDIMSIQHLWSSSDWLNTLLDPNVIVQRTYASTDSKRYIFSFADADGDMIADSGEQVAFESPALPAVADLSDQSKIYPYISVYPWLSATAPSYINDQRIACEAAAAACGPFHDFLQRQTLRVVNFIRGEDQGAYTSGGFGASDYTIPTFRSRQVDYNDDSTLDTWRMSDIVNSTPTLVSAPAEKYDQIYGDSSYATFFNQYRNRRNVVYVGANDGMFHAFNAGFYNSSLKKFELQLNAETQYPLGAEIWAYVPHNLLPHLYWLTDVDYEHVYYVDLKPRVFDAKIFPADATHPGGWGTVLVGAMRFGGGEIGADLDKTDGSLAFDAATDRKMSSAYFIMDITDPESPPVLLAEITLSDLGYTTNYPVVLPIIDAATSTNKWVPVPPPRTRMMAIIP